MSKRSYCPDRGDIVSINFMPAAGREIDKRRPALILSPKVYNATTGLCLAVPISSDTTAGPFWILVPDRLLDRPSLVLCDYVRSLDWRERAVALIGPAPKNFVDSVVERIMDVIDPLFR